MSIDTIFKILYLFFENNEGLVHAQFAAPPFQIATAYTGL